MSVRATSPTLRRIGSVMRQNCRLNCFDSFKPPFVCFLNMPKRPPRSHFSPKFANKHWTNDENTLSCYRRDARHHVVVSETKGLKPWATQRGLYTLKVEKALDKELENYAAPIYEKLCVFQQLSLSERTVWAQFLLSQIVRTPTYLRYELVARSLHGITEQPSNDRVGCRDCLDLLYVTSRDWCLLQSHPDDSFVRSDNPVLLSGFIERAETCLYYPISPRICFVALSFPKGPDRKCSTVDEAPPILGRQLSKGDTWAINFHVARAADESLVLGPDCQAAFPAAMFGEILGTYPQPPFALHSPETNSFAEAFESIRSLMSVVDGRDYPCWHPFELEPFY